MATQLNAINRFKTAPTHLNQVAGSCFLKLKTVSTTPVKQKIIIAFIGPRGGFKYIWPLSNISAVRIKRYTNKLVVISAQSMDNFENKV